MRSRPQYHAAALLLMAAAGLGLCAQAPAARADDWLAVWPACAIEASARPELALLYPTIDLPALVQAGDTLSLRIRTPVALTPPPGIQQERVLEAFEVELESAALRVGVPDAERHRHAATVVSIRPDGADTLVYRVRVVLPAYLADGTYRLSVRTLFGVRSSERAVRVLARGEQPRLSRLPAGVSLPPSAAAVWPVDLWLSELAPDPDLQLPAAGVDAAPVLRAAGPAIALRVRDQLWVRSGCGDPRSFEREIASVLARESRTRVELATAWANIARAQAAALERKASLSIGAGDFTLDNRASAAPSELTLLLPFAASARADVGTLAFHPAREPSARAPSAKLARFRVPAGARAKLSIGRDSSALSELAVVPHRVHSGQPAHVRVLGADARAQVAFAWGVAGTAYASPNIVATFSGPLAHPVHAHVFRADGRGQVAHGHVWVEPYRPRNCAVARLGAPKHAFSPFSGAFWYSLALVAARRLAKNARGRTRPE